MQWSKLRARLLPPTGRVSEANFAEITRRAEANIGEKDGRRPKKRVLLVSSNGAGLGHLTRLAAISRFLNAQSLFYTLSSAYHVLGKSSKEIIYFPSYGDIGLDGATWNPLLKAHFGAVVKGFQPDIIIFDGTYVYRGVTAVARQRGIPLVWLQRGCWRGDVLERSVQRRNPEDYVDQIVVPRDYGCLENEGQSQGVLTPEYIDPVTLLGRKEILQKQEARTALGLPSDKRLFLIQLGAGVLNDTNQIKSLAIDAVREIGEDWEPVLVANPLRKDFELINKNFLTVSAYPLLRYLKAFDAAVLAAGYNSIQESVVAELPAIFVPNTKTKTDDQVRRARGMSNQGLGITATNSEQIQAGIRRLESADLRGQFQEKLSLAGLRNGAEEIEAALEKY
ncbi:glycosyltransferase [Corynebacterium hadale]|uniref:glycosyltransferase n=1 Tax=Corynebacterium hadale TaxID=2026255 RepID=UPI000D6A786B|nr:glycosyltransferase [Corynebacterium hadale]